MVSLICKTFLSWFGCVLLAVNLLAVGLLAVGATNSLAQEHDPAEPAGAAHAGGADDHAAEGGAAHAAGGGHDDSDLSHANLSDSAMAPEEFEPQLAIATLLVFGLLLLILWKFAWGPIVAALENREKAIASQIEEARLNAEKAKELLRQHEQRMATAQDEIREMMAQARRDADAARERLLAEADSEAKRMRERAVADINNAKDAALREIAQRSVDTAVGLAGQIVRREIRPEDHAQLINESLAQFQTNAS